MLDTPTLTAMKFWPSSMVSATHAVVYAQVYHNILVITVVYAQVYHNILVITVVYAQVCHSILAIAGLMLTIRTNTWPIVSAAHAIVHAQVYQTFDGQNCEDVLFYGSMVIVAYPSYPRINA